MTIDEAINQLKYGSPNSEKYEKAIQLGIEASEREKKIRETIGKPHTATNILILVGDLLPSEKEA